MNKSLLVYISFYFFIHTQILYSQNYGQWSAAAPMHLGRIHAASIVLPNGNVLVTGGEIDSSISVTNTCEIFDVQNNTWHFVDSMNYPRFYHQLILIDSNDVLAIGGYNQKSCEIYSIDKNEWTLTDSLKIMRNFGWTTTLLNDGQVIVVGGLAYSSDLKNTYYLNDVEIYNPNTKKWRQTDSLKIGRYGHTATLLHSGELLVAGGAGKECEIFNPSNEKWSIADSLNIERYQQSAVLLTNGNVLIAGGENYNDPTNPWLNSCEDYNPTENKWTVVTPMYFARFDHSSILLFNGLILFTGGDHGNDTWELYDPDTFKNLYWAKYPVTQSAQEIKLLNNGNIISIGGFTWKDSSLPVLSATNMCEIYSTITGIIHFNSNIRSFNLFQNFPNPFNPTTRINYDINTPGNVKIVIYNTLGQKIKTLINQYTNTGTHSIIFNGSSIPSGIYFYRLQSGSFISTKKMLLLK